MRERNIVILGSGFAGLACAEKLQAQLPRDEVGDLLVVGSENYFTFHALLPEVVGGELEARHVIHPVRRMLRRCEFLRADVSTIDLQRREVRFDTAGPVRHEPVRAEHLVLAMGSGIDMQAVPGMMEHAFFLKTLADALELRGHVVRRLEEATAERDFHRRCDLLQFVVVGGGFSGVEVAGQMQDMLAAASKYYPALRETPAKVTLIQSRDILLPELDAQLGRKAQRSLEKRGLDVILNRRVVAVSGNGVRLDDGRRIPASNVVCTIGNAPHPVLRPLAVECYRGRILTDEFLRVKGLTHVWATGDCAACPDGTGGICAPTGQFATRLGKHLAGNLSAARNGRRLQPFHYQSVGQVASIGHHNGVAKFWGLRMSGFLAWWLARSVHLALLPGLERKMRVMIDWTLDLFFPRDINYLDLRKTEAVGHIHLEPEEVLFHQGDQSHTFYVIERGKIELMRRNQAGETTFREDLFPGMHFGEGSLVRDRVRTTTATAKEPTTLLEIGPRDFDSLYATCTALRQTLEETSYRFRPEEEFAAFRWPDDVLTKSVHEVMSQPVDILPMNTSLADAFLFLAQHGHGTIPLVDSDGRLAATVTRTDLYQAAAREPDMSVAVHEIASRQVTTLSPDQTIRKALALFRRKRLKHAPVVDADGHPVGIVSYLDVAVVSIQTNQSQGSLSDCR